MSHDIDILIVQLRDGRAQTRAEAARTLSEHPDVLAKTDLIRCLDDPDERVRYWAIHALARLEDEAVTQRICRSLQDPEAPVRMAAARALTRRPEKSAAGPLLDCLSDSSENVVYWVSAALTRLGTYVLPQLVSHLGDQSWRRRQAAARTLVRMGAPAVDALIKALSRDDEHIPFWSLIALGHLRARKAVPAILPFLKSDRNDRVAAAATSLGQIGSKEALSHLLPLLGHKDEAVRTAAVGALGAFGDVSVRVLTQLLSCHHRVVRLSASQSLSLVGDASLKTVLETLGDENTDLRFWAIKALERIGNPVIVPVFVGLLQDDDRDVQLAAATALAHFELDGETAGGLLEHLGNPEWRVRRALADSLARQRHLDPSVFRRGIRSKNEDVRFWTVRILGDFGRAEAIPLLVGLFRDGSWNIRKQAAESIARLGERATPYLVQALQKGGEDGDVRYWVTRSMCGIRDHALVGVLVPMLVDEDPAVRANAEEALVAIGGDALPALLTAMRTSESRLFRAQVAEVLVRLQPAPVAALVNLFQFKDPEINYWTCHVLGRLGSAVVEPMAEVFETGNERRRHLALQVLAQVDTPRTRQICIAALEDEYIALRKVAVTTLGRFGVEEALPALEAALEDAEDDYRQVLIVALGRIGTDSVLPILVEHLEHPRWEIRKAAVEAIGELGGAEAVPALVARLESRDDVDLHVFVIRALGCMGSSEACEVLRRFLDASSEELLVAAIQALGRVGDSRTSRRIETFLSARSWEVRKAALEALGELGTVENLEPVKALMKTDDLVLRNLARGVMRSILGEAKWGEILDVAIERSLRAPAAELYTRARELRDAGSPEQAVRLVQAALRRHKSASSYALLGTLHLEGRRLDLAKKNLERGLAIEPAHPVLRSRLAMTCFLRGDTDEATELFEALLAAPSTPPAIVTMARRTLARMGRGRKEG